MKARQNQITRPATRTEDVAGKIRKELEGGSAGMADVIQSERELAKRFGVGRITVRRALKRLVADGYLVSRPRQGYRVAFDMGRPRKNLLAFVHGSPRMPWEWTDFELQTWNSFQQAAAEAGRSLLAVGRENRSPEELGRYLRSLGARGCIVDADDSAVHEGVRAAGVPVVQVDAAAPGFAAVTQDNFGGAFRATMRLVERGHTRIAWLGCDFRPNPNQVHFDERLGGYLAAMDRAGLNAPKSWRVVGRPVKPAVERLISLASKKNGPEAAVVLWPELLDDLGEGLSEAKLGLEVVVWWGAMPERRERWRSRFPKLPIPEGMAWKFQERAAAAIRLFDDVSLGRTAPERLLVPVQLVPGEKRGGRQ